MKLGKMLLAAAAGCAIAFSGPAGAAPAAPNRVPRPAARWMAAVRQLNLTQSQKDQIKVYVKAGRTVAEEIRSDKTLTPAQKRERQTLNARSTREKVMGVLTPAQKAKLARMARAQGPEWKAIMARLNLAPKQKQAIQGYLKDAVASAKAVRGNSSLAPEQKRARMLEIRKETRRKVLAALTPEQRRKAAALLKARAQRA